MLLCTLIKYNYTLSVVKIIKLIHNIYFCSMPLFNHFTEEEKKHLLKKIKEKTKDNPSKKKLYYYYFGIEKKPPGILTPRITDEEIKELLS